MRGSVNNNAPDPNSTVNATTGQYKLAYHVNEFFRVFQWVGSVEYSKEVVAGFYKRIRLAQASKLTGSETQRMLRFYMASKVYARWALPAQVEEAFVKYMKFFEKNLSSFTKETGKLTFDPGDGAKNLEYAFEDKLDEVYIPKSQRKTIVKDSSKMSEVRRNADANWYTILNTEFDTENKRARGKTNNYQSSYTIGATLDNKIDDLRGDRAWASTQKVTTAKADNRSHMEPPSSPGRIPNYKEIMPENKAMTEEESKRKREKEKIRAELEEEQLQQQ